MLKLHSKARTEGRMDGKQHGVQQQGLWRRGERRGGAIRHVTTKKCGWDDMQHVHACSRGSATPRYAAVISSRLLPHTGRLASGSHLMTSSRATLSLTKSPPPPPVAPTTSSTHRAGDGRTRLTRNNSNDEQCHNNGLLVLV